MKHIQSCYCCEKPATSREHAPPLCFFPDTKDLMPGQNMRRRLITVPACEEHNSKKSKDDEYLLFAIAVSMTTNNIGIDHFLTKIMRSIDRDATLAKRFLSNASKLTVQGDETHPTYETALVSAENSRIRNSLEAMGRAIYFHQFQKKWMGAISVHPEFLAFPDLNPETPENRALIQMRKAIAEIFESLPRLGHNPAVFQYQFAPGGPEFHTLARFHFYGKTRATLIFNHDA